MVDLYCDIEIQRLEGFDDNTDDLGVADHRIVFAGYIEIALMELAKPTTGDCRLIPAIHLSDMVSFHLSNVVHGEPSSEGYG